MRTFAIVSQPFGTFAVTANADGSIGLNAQIVAERDEQDAAGNGLRLLVDQANSAVELWAALQGLLSSMEPPRTIKASQDWDEARIVLAKYRSPA